MNHYSQQDTRWKDDIIGISENKTIGKYGCLLTCVAMVCTEFGHKINPGELNKLYQAVNGFDGANLIIRLVSSVYPDVYQAELIPCGKDIDAPLSLIYGYLEQGIPVIVQLDQSPVDGHQEHWVVITAMSGKDYIILDPWDLESVGTSLIDDYGFDSKDPAAIITSVLVLNQNQTNQVQPVEVEDEYNASVVAVYGAVLHRTPKVSVDNLLVCLSTGTRLMTTSEVMVVDGYSLRGVRCYIAETDLDGTPILKVDDDA